LLILWNKLCLVKMIISKTPVRISFLGGGTDYPSWYNHHIGMVLGTTIDKYVYLTVGPKSPLSKWNYRVFYSELEECATIEEIRHKAVRATLGYLGITDGAEVYYARDLPAQSGIGSSSAFVVGLLNAFINNDHNNQYYLAKEATEIEHDILQENVGSQDQILCAYGGLNQIVWHPTGTHDVRPIELEPERLEEFQSHLMLFYTHARNQGYVSEVKTEYTSQETEQLRRLAGMVKDGVSVLTNNYSITDFGILLDEGWNIKKDTGANVSNFYIDDIYNSALRAGALGGKLLGSGGGGFMLIFCEPQYQPDVLQTLSKLVHVPFRFENQGSVILTGV